MNYKGWFAINPIKSKEYYYTKYSLHESWIFLYILISSAFQ